MPKSTTNNGYTNCACRDCFEIAIGKPGSALCHGCEEAGCEAGADCECSAPHAYGGDEGCDFEDCAEERAPGCDFCAAHEAEHQENLKGLR